MPAPESFQAAFAAALSSRSSGALASPALERALAVHRNTAFSALERALGDNYPVLRALVGEKSFKAAAGEYVSRHPPKDPRLCFYGEDLVGFIEGHQPFQSLAYLREVADLERRLVGSLFAADAAAAAGEDFSSGLDLQAPLQLHPATAFGAYQAPVVSLWRLHQKGAPEDGLSSLEWTSQIALITRPRHELMLTAISPGALAFAAACRAGLSLAAAAQGVAAAGSELSNAFAELIAAGAFLKP